MKIPVRMTNKIHFSLFIKTIATAHDVFTVMCNAVPVNPPVDLNFKFPISHSRTLLQPYNHVECVKNPINNLVDYKLSEPAIGYTTFLKQHTAYL